MRSQETYPNMSGMLQMLLGAKAGGPYAVTALIIAGGAGGAAGVRGAGGGAGGVQESASAVVTPLTGYTVTVGSGGSGASSSSNNAGAGSILADSVDIAGSHEQAIYALTVSNPSGTDGNQLRILKI